MSKPNPLKVIRNEFRRHSTMSPSDFEWLVLQAHKLEKVMEYCNQTLPTLVTRDIGTTYAIGQLKAVRSIIERK